MSNCPREAAIRVLMMPRDTNYHGTIFGGVILSHIDQAGAVAAIAYGCRKVATVAMDKVEFHQPVRVGELVSFYTEIIRVGRTSITIKVNVEALQRDSGEAIAVTSAIITFVNLDDNGKKIPVPQVD